jgi:hypothetical protein
LSSASALARSFAGLTVALASGSHSPPKLFSSSTRSPRSPATIARAPTCTSARAALTVVRACEESRSAVTICSTVAPASVRGSARFSLLSAVIAMGDRRGYCHASAWLFPWSGRTHPSCVWRRLAAKHRAGNGPVVRQHV